MKSILKKVAGVAVAAALAFGMAGCSTSGSSPEPEKETVATPAFSVDSGTVDSGTSVTITCATEGAKIYYTTDGNAPTAASTEYTSAINVTEAVTIKAIAVKDGMNDSEVASVSYTIKPDYSKCVVGDFILKDGTILSKEKSPENGTVAAVIVRAAADGKPALGVGIVHNRSGLEWCTKEASGYGINISVLVGDKTSDYMDGSDSWDILVKNCNDLKEATKETFETVAEKYPAFNYCRKYGENNGLKGDLANGWYLPTVAELYTIYQNKAVVEESLTKAGGSNFGDNFGDSIYWSCCQHPDRNFAQLLIFSSGNMSVNEKVNYTIYVCSVRAFN